MLALPGSLESSTLGDILGDLHREAISGTLRLIEWVGGAREHTIHWRSGLIHGVQSPTAVSSLHSLMTRGASSQATQFGTGGQATDFAHRWAEETALKSQRLERLNHLFGLRRAKLRFGAAAGATAVQSPQPLHPTEFLHGRPRLRDIQPVGFSPAGQAPESAVAPEQQREVDLLTLGLGCEATPDQIRNHFRQLARRWHPDMHGNASEATKTALGRRFARLTAAYRRLTP